MKKITTILMILILTMSLALVVSAKETEKSGQWSIKPSVTTSVTPPLTVKGGYVSGQEIENGEQLTAPVSEAMNVSTTPLKNYVEEKIMPIIVGVATSIIALLSTLKCVFSALKGLKDSKATFDKEQEKIREESARELQKITEKYGEIKMELEGVYKLSPQLEAVDKRTLLLAKEIANLSKIVSLGYSSDKELIKVGVARECAVLAGKNGEMIDDETI